jgi:hypothetical protein
MKYLLLIIVTATALISTASATSRLADCCQSGKCCHGACCKR